MKFGRKQVVKEAFEYYIPQRLMAKLGNVVLDRVPGWTQLDVSAQIERPIWFLKPVRFGRRRERDLRGV